MVLAPPAFVEEKSYTDPTPFGARGCEGGYMNERLVAFLYLLMRDEVVPGRIAQLLRDIRAVEPGAIYTNKHLEGYAREIADRIMSE